MRTVLIFHLPCSAQETLDARLDARVDTMLEQGLMAELEAFWRQLHAAQPAGLMNNGQLDYTRGILQAIGFKEFEPYLLQQCADAEPTAKRLRASEEEEPENVLAVCVEQMKRATRRYARRQLTWLRNRLLRQTDFAVYRMDSTRPQDWAQTVRSPALALACALVNNESPPPALVAQHQASTANSSATATTRPMQHRCEPCGGRVYVGEHQWQEHLRSRRHKKAAANARRRRDRKPAMDDHEAVEGGGREGKEEEEESREEK
mgnify:CR=1 FL=1